MCVHITGFSSTSAGVKFYCIVHYKQLEIALAHLLHLCVFNTEKRSTSHNLYCKIFPHTSTHDHPHTRSNL